MHEIGVGHAAEFFRQPQPEQAGVRGAEVKVARKSTRLVPARHVWLELADHEATDRLPERQVFRRQAGRVQPEGLHATILGPPLYSSKRLLYDRQSRVAKV